MKISVLMSIYNESVEEINESLLSIYNQTEKDFELIVVIDNPSRKNILLEIPLLSMDERTKVVFNDVNIGLALSMNKAASLANGKYLLRMDADDISIETRFENQLKIMENNDIDLCCSEYIYIDEKSNVIDKSRKHYSNSELTKKLPFFNTIHHPTVIMRKDVFDKVGGYRDFPCTQDYDLWLRLYEINAKFYICEDILLLYRIRDNSISSSKKYQQIATTWYIQNLYWYRKFKFVDNYSIINYNNYLSNLKINNIEYLKKLKYLESYVDLNLNFMKKIYLSVNSKFYRIYYFRIIFNKILSCII